MRPGFVDPLVTVITPNNRNYTRIQENTLYKELTLGRRIKYFFRNRSSWPDDVKRMIEEREINFTAKDVLYVDANKFQRIKHGTYMKLEPHKKSKK